MTEKGWVVYDSEAIDAIEKAYNQGKPECDLGIKRENQKKQNLVFLCLVVYVCICYVYNMCNIEVSYYTCF